MKTIFFVCFLTLFHTLGAMTESNNGNKAQAQKQPDEKTSQALLSLESINKRLAKTTVADDKGRCETLVLTLTKPIDIDIGTKKELYLLHGNRAVGSVIYSAPYATSDLRYNPKNTGYSITFFRTLEPWLAKHGLGTILSLFALSDAFALSQCSSVFVDRATKGHAATIHKFWFTPYNITVKISDHETEEIQTQYSICTTLSDFLQTKAPELLEQAFIKLEKKNTTLAQDFRSLFII